MSYIRLAICIAVSLLWVNRSLNALECYTCDSAEDAECAIKPGQQINVEECVKDNDECVTAVAAGVTRRGCLSRMFPNNYCAEPCDHCNTSLCNRYIFPTNRLRCYQCSGADCIDVKDKSALLLPCPIYNSEDRCYTNILHISNVQRGCEKTNLPTTCPHTCLKCNYNGCNNEVGVTEASCYQCTHNQLSPNYNCLRNQNINNFATNCTIEGVNTCKNKILYGNAEKCFTYVNEQTGVFQRGCSTTMGFYPTGELEECYGNNCNNKCYTISCNTCNSTSNFNCRLGRNLNPVKCETGVFSCSSCERGTLVRRSCSNLTLNSLAENEEICYKCSDANGCNRTPIRTCYRCSSLEIEECSNWNDSTQIPRQNCSSPEELCVSTLLKKFNLVYTVRGCASQVIECTDSDPFCVRCNGSLCNREPINWVSNKVVQLTNPTEGSYLNSKNIATSTILKKFYWSCISAAFYVLFYNYAYNK